MEQPRGTAWMGSYWNCWPRSRRAGWLLCVRAIVCNRNNQKEAARQEKNQCQQHLHYSCCVWRTTTWPKRLLAHGWELPATTNNKVLHCWLAAAAVVVVHDKDEVNNNNNRSRIFWWSAQKSRWGRWRSRSFKYYQSSVEIATKGTTSKRHLIDSVRVLAMRCTAWIRWPQSVICRVAQTMVGLSSEQSIGRSVLEMVKPKKSKFTTTKHETEDEAKKPADKIQNLFFLEQQCAHIIVDQIS